VIRRAGHIAAVAARRGGVIPTGILSIGRATPALRVTQEQSFQYSGYRGNSIRKLFLNTGIEFRHFYFENALRVDETSDELNRRYLHGAMETGSKAARACLAAGGLSPRDVDLLVVCTSTGYVCPDIGSRLVGPLGLRPDVQRASMVGLGCAGAIPSLQRACDFATAHPGRIALVLAVEICSACYYVDDTLETVVGNALCADGAAAVLLTSGSSPKGGYPAIVDFASFLAPEHLDLVGLEHCNGKLRIVLGAEVPEVASSLIQGAITPLLERHGLSRSDIRFWVTHPGGSRVLVNLGKQLGLPDAALQYAGTVLRDYGNMSSPTVLFVLDEVIRQGEPRPGDWGAMTALGPGMAGEVALLQW
jgi:predicted naringenin-chalcone synthase